jgi:hypothetical protein
MLGIGCPGRHALPLTHPSPPPKMYRPRRTSSRESGFVVCQYARIVHRWVERAGLDSSAYGKHSLRPNVLLGHMKLESTVQYRDRW